LPNTCDWVPSTILTEGDLFERFNKTNFYLTTVMCDEAPESISKAFKEK